MKKDKTENKNTQSRIAKLSKERYKGPAFTLAEVLITLGIIGIVAALTIPSLIKNYRARELHSQFNKSYAMLQQAVRRMQADDVSMDMSDYTSRTFYLTFIKYFQGAALCGTSISTKGGDVCYDFKNPKSYYKLFNGTSDNCCYPSRMLDDGQFLLQDGKNIYFENNSTETIFVSVDINGYKNLPNRWGYDLFTFQYIDSEIKPMGDAGTTYIGIDTYCNINSTHAYNGMACTSLAKSDPDYFKKLEW